MLAWADLQPRLREEVLHREASETLEDVAREIQVHKATLCRLINDHVLTKPCTGTHILCEQFVARRSHMRRSCGARVSETE